MTSKTSDAYPERIPVLKSGRADIDQWERKFNDHAIGARWKGLFNGTEDRPQELTAAELQQIPVAQRYSAQRDRLKEIKDFVDRSEAAFAGISKAMEDDSLIYASAELDQLRRATPRDPTAAYELVMNLLRPTHVDAQMTAETRISNFLLLKDESVPAAFQRLLSYVNCLEVHNRPDDLTMMRHMKRAIKSDPTMSKQFMTKVESLMDKEPPIDFATFCTGLRRKHEEIQSEVAQQAAMHTEANQETNHHVGETEAAMYTGGNGTETEAAMYTGGKGKGRGRGGKGYRSMGKGYTDARVGALYYGKGGSGDRDYYQPDHFWRGGGRRNGGRGFQFDQYAKGGAGRGGGRGGAGKKGGAKGSTYKPKFDGFCHRCDLYGHRESDCYANLKRARK